MAREKITARSCALDLLEAVLDRHELLDDALAGHAGLARLETRDRGFARLLCATTLRRLGQIDDLVGRFLARPIPAKARVARHILRLGACQLLFLGTPAHAAVSEAVRLARARAPGPFAGLVNAVLRRVAAEGAPLADAQDAARLCTPDWLWRGWCAAYGEPAARAIAAAHLSEPPLDLSVKGDPVAWAERLGATILPTGSLRRAAGGAIADLPGYAEGAWWVQDAAAAIPARLLGDVAGATVIDLCAAPGGKSAQLAAAGARVVALDRPARLARLADNLARLGLAAERIAVDDAAGWRPPAPAAFVLLDAPCSTTGAIRRHPDIPHNKSAADVTRLARVQDSLLTAAADMLGPNGTLVYCVCSLEPAEGPERVRALLERTPGLARAPVSPDEIGGLGELITPQGELRTLPCHLAGLGGLDGFYAARLRRRGQAAN